MSCASGLSAIAYALQEFGAKGSFIQYGGVADHALVVRGITTVYNTDYITDVIFHLNGAIKVRHTCVIPCLQILTMLNVGFSSAVVY